MATPDDLVDKVLDTGYSWLLQSNKLIAQVVDQVLSGVDAVVKQQQHADLSSPVGTLPDAHKGASIFTRMLSGRTTAMNIKRLVLYLGVSASTAVLFWQAKRFIQPLAHIPCSKKECVLVYGDTCDPIIRSQVTDLYRRGFVVFLCSRNAKTAKEHEEDNDFIHHIDPTSSADLTHLVEYIRKMHDPQIPISILFMPRLSYYPSGLISAQQLQTEIGDNILTYYDSLCQLLPVLQRTIRSLQLILFNPSLSYNLSIAHHPAEIFVSGLISSLYKLFQSYKNLDVYMIHVGIVKIAGQPSNYKYLHLPGSNINDTLLERVYQMIIYHNGNCIQKLVHWLYTLGGLDTIYHLGTLSKFASIPFSKYMMRVIVILYKRLFISC